MSMYNVKTDPSTGPVRHAYHRDGMTDLAKMRESAIRQAQQGYVITLHHHPHKEQCEGHKHEHFGNMEEEKNDD